MPTNRRYRGRRRTSTVSSAVIEFLRTGQLPAKGDQDWWDVFELTGDDAQRLKAIWMAEGEELLEAWIAAHPGTRPWAWWKFDAPRWQGPYPGRAAGMAPGLLRAMGEPRQRLGGAGTPAFEVLNVWPAFTRGVPDHFVSAFDVSFYNGRSVDIHGKRIGLEHHEGHFGGVAPDPSDPPIFESEACYLRRHGLLTAAEHRRIASGQFEPEALLVNDPTRGDSQ